VTDNKGTNNMTRSTEVTVVLSRGGAWVQVRQLQPQAVASWWQPGHPGWAIYPVDSEQFMSTGALDNVSVPNDSTLVAPPPPDSPGDCAGSFDFGAMHLLPTVLITVASYALLAGMCVKQDSWITGPLHTQLLLTCVLHRAAYM